jgi:hypothetical protein
LDRELKPVAACACRQSALNHARSSAALHVIRQPSPWSLTANFGERLADLVRSALPGR